MLREAEPVPRLLGSPVPRMFTTTVRRCWIAAIEKMAEWLALDEQGLLQVLTAEYAAMEPPNAFTSAPGPAVALLDAVLRLVAAGAEDEAPVWAAAGGGADAALCGWIKVLSRDPAVGAAVAEPERAARIVAALRLQPLSSGARAQALAGAANFGVL